MKKKFFALSMAVLLVLVSVIGCSTDSADGSYVTFNLGTEPTTLDPSKGADNYSNTILTNVLEPLTRTEEMSDGNTSVEPAGAESWESNEDGTVWTFKIRDNKWSDGEKVRAQDYEYGIKRSIDRETASPYAFILMSIKNAAAINAGEMDVEELGVKSLDDKTLEITLEGTTPYFIDLTSQRVMLPQRQDVVEEQGDKYGSEPETLLFNGPFTLDEWVHNSELILVKNKDYWDADTVQVDTVNLKIIQDENAAYSSLENNSLDLLGVNQSDWKKKFLEMSDVLDHEEIVNTQTFFMFFNTQDEVFKNANIRKAFAASIDRKELADVIFYGVHAPAYGWVPPSMSLGDSEYRSVVQGPVEKLIADNPDPQKLLIEGLEELGMDTDPANLTVRISLGGTDQWFKTYGEYLQETFINVLGVDFQVEQMDWPVFNAAVQDGDFQMGYMAWGADYNDPQAMLSLLRSDAGAIGTGWVNERYDELIDLAAGEMDPAKRYEYFEEAENILLYEDSPLTPIAYPRSNVFRYKYLKGTSSAPFVNQGYKYINVDGR